jgi:hypothetical protein
MSRPIPDGALIEGRRMLGADADDAV